MIVAIRGERGVRVPRQTILAVLKRAERAFGKRRKDLPELSLLVTTSRRVRVLNRQYRHKDEPTDVLSFEYGEIVIAHEVAKRQAVHHKVSLSKELSLLATHGYLHILGFDHVRPKDKMVMAQAEKKILGMSGLIDRSSDTSVVKRRP